jgi:hypothetical protein
VLYADEVDVHLNPRIGRDWMLPGQQRRVVTPGKNQKFYLAGALDVRTGVLHMTGTERKNAGLFCALLELLDKRYGPGVRRIHVILDNYGIHSARMTCRTLNALEGRIVLHFLPPYCPDANRIERVWQDSTPTLPATTAARPCAPCSPTPASTSTPTSGAASPAWPLQSGWQRDVVRGSRSLI